MLDCLPGDVVVLIALAHPSIYAVLALTCARFGRLLREKSSLAKSRFVRHVIKSHKDCWVLPSGVHHGICRVTKYNIINITPYDTGVIHGVERKFRLDNGLLYKEISYKWGKKDGVMMKWHENGRIRCVATYVDDRRYGIYECWHSNGNRHIVCRFGKDGYMHGFRRIWYPNGQLATSGRWKAGRPVGVHKTWLCDGKIKDIVTWDDDEYKALKLVTYTGDVIVTETFEKDGSRCVESVTPRRLFFA